jgi:hypothetical protein
MKAVRHILSLSGGKDSTALALFMRDKVKDEQNRVRRMENRPNKRLVEVLAGMTDIEEERAACLICQL